MYQSNDSCINVIYNYETTTVFWGVLYRSETLISAHNQVRSLRKTLLDLSNSSGADIDILREKIGHCLYTIQQFYSNTNWVEINGGTILKEFGMKFWNSKDFKDLRRFLYAVHKRITILNIWLNYEIILLFKVYHQRFQLLWVIRQTTHVMIVRQIQRGQYFNQNLTILNGKFSNSCMYSYFNHLMTSCCFDNALLEFFFF